MLPTLSEVGQLRAQGVSPDQLQDVVMSKVAGLPVAKQIRKRVQRRRGDDRYNEVNYDTDPGNPDAPHAAAQHEKDAMDVAAEIAFETMQRRNGRKLAEAFIATI